MKVSQGASYGHHGEFYHLELFSDREEVIFFKKEKFASSFNSMMNSIEFFMI